MIVKNRIKTQMFALVCFALLLIAVLLAACANKTADAPFGAAPETKPPAAIPETPSNLLPPAEGSENSGENGASLRAHDNSEDGEVLPIPADSAENYIQAVPLKYDEVGYFSEGLAPVRMAAKWGFIDASGKEVIPPI